MLAWESYANFIGDIGEAFAISSLRAEGYRVRRGETCTMVGNMIPRGMSELDAIPELECQDLAALTGLCYRLLDCKVPSVPCQTAPSEFFSSYSTRDASFGTTDTGDSRFRSYCAGKLSYLVATGQCEELCGTKCCPLKAQIQIEHYIGFLYYERERHPRRSVWFKRWKGAPGRLDLFAMKDGVLYALDVKTNKGKLSEWQILRMTWLKQRGFHPGTVKVILENTAADLLKDIHEQVERQFDEKWKSLPSNEECIREPALMNYRGDELGKLRATLIPEAIARAVVVAKPSCTVEDLDPAQYDKMCSYLPSEAQVRLVCDTLWCWSSVQWRDGRIRPSRKEFLDSVVSQLPIPN